ncbi:MAG: lamin tail domain-containing protein [Bacillota bacterium]
MLKGVSFLLILSVPFITLLPQSRAHITFTEIMFNPSSANGEFIELYNTSSNDTLNLSHYKIKYQSSQPDSVTSAGGGVLLLPMSYAVIFEGDYDLQSGQYSTIVPAEALKLKINDNAFGATGMSNTSDRTLYLISDADTLEVYTYSANNPAGISDEKIFTGKDNSPGGWTNSLQSLGTPGKINSVTSVNNFLSISSPVLSPAHPKQGDDLSLSYKIFNNSPYIVHNLNVDIFNDLNFDSSGSAQELFFSKTFREELSPGDSLEVIGTLNSISSGYYQCICIITAIVNKDTLSRKILTTFNAGEAELNFNDLVINEIMYAPSQGEPEWIEVYNRSNTKVNLKKWKISDNSTTAVISSKEERFIEPGQYVILCKDSSIKKYYDISSEIIYSALPSLNNTGDLIVLSDSSGKAIDSTRYLPAWGGSNGLSLERVSSEVSSYLPLNWKTCISKSKATPGKINSVSRKLNDPAVVEIIFKPEFPLLNNDVAIFAKIKNSGLLPSYFTLRLEEDEDVNSKPDKLLEISDNLNLLPGDSLIYAFAFFVHSLANERSFTVSIVSENDQDSSNNFVRKNISPGYPPGSIIVNEIMYSPSGGEPEWVELYNTMQDTVCIKDWTLSDLFTAPSVMKFSKSGLSVPPFSYAVITSDSSIFHYHPGIFSTIVFGNLPQLNNDEDGIVIKDSRGVRIDSVRYISFMGGLAGFSLERKSVMDPSTDINNWFSSKDIKKSTPGQINSISIKDYDLSISEISFFPKSPLQGDSLFIDIKVVNTGKKDIQDFSIQLLTADSNSSPLSLQNEFQKLQLKASRSLIFSSPFPVILNHEIILAAKVICTVDEDTSDNYLEIKVTPGYSRNSVVINEVMYSPADNEPEWFELLNTSEEDINIGCFSFSVLSNPLTKNTISKDKLVIHPGEFMVITKDSLLQAYYPSVKPVMNIVGFKSLGNTTDGIVLYDSFGNIIDSLKYNSAWGGRKGRSLERFSTGTLTCDSTNWANSLSKTHGTPGEKNSILDLTLYTRNCTVINEVMFDPSTGNCQFIELFNNSNDNVDLSDWQIYNKNGIYHYLSNNAVILPKGEYFILAADSSIAYNYPWLKGSQYYSAADASTLGLLKTEDRIIIKDAFGNVVDSVYYSVKWHNPNVSPLKNRSLERVNPQVSSNDQANWSTSLSEEGATPGKLNSIYVLNQKADKKFSVLPNPFSPDNDGFEDYTIINYNFPDDITGVRVKVFDSYGRLVRTLISPSNGPHGSIIFDGMDDNRNPLRIGIYILLIEQLGTNSVAMETIKSVVVVARKL